MISIAIRLAGPLLLCLAAALASAALIWALRPLMTRYALARPNARSLHREPTPQGGGIAVIAAACLAMAFGGEAFGLTAVEHWRLAEVGLAALGLAAMGVVDDIRPLPPWPRLAVQFLLVALALAAVPSGLRMFGDAMPLLAERALLLVAGVWFVNLVNFMDGMDWMTVVEMVPLSVGLVILSAMGAVPREGALAALALLGGLIGFAPFNRPRARLFLGDVGSLPIGLIAGYGLALLACRGELAAAVLLPLYYLADSGLTLGRRLFNRERVWEAHRTHFYQLAVARGFSTPDVLKRVGGLNLALLALALASVAFHDETVSVMLLIVGMAATGLMLRHLARGRAPA